MVTEKLPTFRKKKKKKKLKKLNKINKKKMEKKRKKRMKKMKMKLALAMEQSFGHWNPFQKIKNECKGGEGWSDGGGEEGK